jgi:hypothetical protein
MAALCIYNILLGQTSVESYIPSSANNNKSKNNKKHVQRYIRIPSLTKHHTDHQPSASGVSTTTTTNETSSDEPDTLDTPRGTDDASPGCVYEVLPHERLYDLGRRENVRTFLRRPLFPFGWRVFFDRYVYIYMVDGL